MRLRQIALAAQELEPTVEAACELLGVEVAYRDPGVATFGLENALMAVGDTFLEVVSPTQEGTTAGRWLRRRGGDAGYMVIFQTADRDALAEDRKRVEELGIRVVWEADLDDAATIHLHPRDIGGAIVSVDVMEPPESWRWAGPEWRSHVRTERAAGIVGAVLAGRDPTGLARRWAAALGREARPLDEREGAEARYEIALDDSRLLFVPGEGEDHLAAIEVRAAAAGALPEGGVLAGTRVVPV